MGIIKRIPFTRDLALIKTKVSSLLPKEICGEYTRDWWFSWLAWGIDIAIYPTLRPMDLIPDELYGDLECGGVDNSTIKNLALWWGDWIRKRLESCNIIDIDSARVDVLYSIIDCGDSQYAQETSVEVWFGFHCEPIEFEYNVQRCLGEP